MNAAPSQPRRYPIIVDSSGNPGLEDSHILNPIQQPEPSSDLCADMSNVECPQVVMGHLDEQDQANDFSSGCSSVDATSSEPLESMCKSGKGASESPPPGCWDTREVIESVIGYRVTSLALASSVSAHLRLTGALLDAAERNLLVADKAVAELVLLFQEREMSSSLQHMQLTLESYEHRGVTLPGRCYCDLHPYLASLTKGTHDSERRGGVSVVL